MPYMPDTEPSLETTAQRSLLGPVQGKSDGSRLLERTQSEAWRLAPPVCHLGPAVGPGGPVYGRT